MFGSMFGMGQCEACGSVEERVFTDSWTELVLCNKCLSRVIEKLVSNPASEGDNLKQLLGELTDYAG